MDQVFLFDTTLRDGMQGTGINYTLKDKLEIARRLDDVGVDYIEAAFLWPTKKKRRSSSR